MRRKLFLGAAFTAGVGFVIAAAFTVISGVQYRMAENQGLEPGYAPAWLVVGTNVGLLLMIFGLLTMAGIGVSALLRRMVENRSG